MTAAEYFAAHPLTENDAVRLMRDFRSWRYLQGQPSTWLPDRLARPYGIADLRSRMGFTSECPSYDDPWAQEVLAYLGGLAIDLCLDFTDKSAHGG